MKLKLNLLLAICVIVLVSVTTDETSFTQCTSWEDVGIGEIQGRVCWVGGVPCYQERACETCAEGPCISE